MERPDVAVIGAGAVGTSVAYHLALQGLRVSVFEKEVAPAMHQSGRNSGVIHTGTLVKPGSEKARYCVEGNRLLREYANERGVAHTIGGMLIIAAHPDELSELEKLYGYGVANGVRVDKVAADEIKDIEPYAKGIEAIHTPDAGSIDSKAFVNRLVKDARNLGAKFHFGAKVAGLNERGKEVKVSFENGRSIVAGAVVNAAGLWADQFCQKDDMRIVPFRGYYAQLSPERSKLVKSHIYGVSRDPRFPFLGVHLSRRFNGQVTAGPGAMVALGREAYGGITDRSGGGLEQMIQWPGFWRMLIRPSILRLAGSEIKKSVSTKAIAKEARQLVPQLRPDDLLATTAFSGNRAQMVDRHGNLVDDTIIDTDSPRVVHVRNAVSPGLTTALPGGRKIAAEAIAKL